MDSGTRISAVILDLDGTLLDTERATKGILKELLANYGKQVDVEKEEKKRLGMTLKDSAASIVKDYNLQIEPHQFIHQIMPMYHHKWKQVKALPGANRLITHLYQHGVPVALASNSLQEYIYAKISVQPGWKDCFSVIIGSDQVQSGKPSPDIFLEAAKRMNVDPAHCLVIEDSMVGVRAAKAAKMKIVAVPSPKETDCSTLADSTLNSLLEFRPELWGLPPFQDWIHNALPIESIVINTLYSGNGSDCELTSSDLPEQVSGVYFGWGAVSGYETFKVVVGIANKKIQICLLDGESDNISGAEMEVRLVGYIRGLDSKAMGVHIVEEDKCTASSSLELPMYDCLHT